MFGDLKKLFGDSDASKLKPLQGLVERINSLEEKMKELPSKAFTEKTAELKARLSKGETLDDVLPDAFALVREASRRTLGERHFDVQLLGGMMLHRRGIAEMRTGEGKTLVATLPAYLNALEGKRVHVVTVNDYLSRRDTVWMGQIYNVLGLSVGVINHDSSFLYDPLHSEKKSEIRNPKSLPAEAASAQAGEANSKAGENLQLKTDVAASFQQAVLDVLIGKTIRAAREYGAKSVLLSGGVSANRTLQETLKLETQKLGANFYAPDREFNTDNAAMIAAAAYIQKLRKKKLGLEAQPNLNL